MKLDQSKPYGEVCGDGVGSCRYEQGGRYFDSSGNETSLPAGEAPDAAKTAYAKGLKDAEAANEAKVAAAVAAAIAKRNA